MGGSEKRMMRREKDGWLSWKEAIQQTTLEEDQLRDLLLSQYSYASIPYKQNVQGAPAGEGVNLQQEKSKAIQVEETPSLQKEVDGEKVGR